MDVNVLTAGHINPDLTIEGQTQRFIHGDPLLPEPTASFKIDNIFVPVVGSPSFTNSEIRNNVLSGYRWIHKTQSTETYGSFRLQKFLNANPIGTDLMILNNDGTFSFPGIFGSLATGILKNTTTTGVISIAVPAIDYYSPGHPTTLLDDYNAGGGTPFGNLAVGTNTLFSLTLNSSSNTNNLAVGPLALFSLTGGSANVAIGKSCLTNLTTASSSVTAVGVGAGLNLTSSNNDCFFGVTAGGASSFVTSSGNSCFGFQTGGNVNNLQTCSFFGSQAVASASNLINATAIGAGATVSASFTMVMGNSSVTNFNIPGLNFGLTANTITSTNTNGNITITPNGTGIISLSSNTGINTTSPTTAKLVVNGGVQNVASEDSCIRIISSSNSAKIELNNTTASTGRLYEERSNNDGTYGIFDRTNSAYRSFIDTNGYMGIGVSSSLKGRVHTLNGPQNQSSEATGICIETTNTNTAKLELRNSNTNGRLYEIQSSNNAGSGNAYFEITDRTGSASRIRILDNGNIGFNNSTPSFTGDFNGAVRSLRLLGNANAPTVSLGAAGQVGTGATSSVTGSEVGGRFSLTTGTGVLTTGLLATFTLASAMPSSSFSVIFYPASGAISLNVTSISSTQFTISNSGLLALAQITNYVWNYQIVGY